MTNMTTAQIRVQGRVQGVYYRASAQTEARQLGLCGWTRNLPDGSVEIMAQGPKALIQQFVAWCRQGPPAAYVEHVELTWQSTNEILEGFRVRY